MPWNFTEEQLAAWQFCPACKYVPGHGTCCRCLSSLKRQEDAVVHPPSTRSCVCRTPDLGHVQCQQILSEADSRIDRHVRATVVCTSKVNCSERQNVNPCLVDPRRKIHTCHTFAGTSEQPVDMASRSSNGSTGTTFPSRTSHARHGTLGKPAAADCAGCLPGVLLGTTSTVLLLQRVVHTTLHADTEALRKTLHFGFLVDRAALCLEKRRGKLRRKQSNLPRTADFKRLQYQPERSGGCTMPAQIVVPLSSRCSSSWHRGATYWPGQRPGAGRLASSPRSPSCPAKYDEEPAPARSRLCKARKHLCPFAEAWRLTGMRTFAPILPKIRVFCSACWPWLCRRTSRREHLTQCP